MSNEIYTAPSSNLNVGQPINGNPAKAVAIGLIISTLAPLVISVVIGIGYAIYFATQGLSENQMEAATNQLELMFTIIYLIVSGMFSVWSGHYVARKTNRKEYKYCTIMFLLGTAMGVALIALWPDLYSEDPLWYTATSFIGYPLTVILGCWLYVKSKNSHS